MRADLLAGERRARHRRRALLACAAVSAAVAVVVLARAAGTDAVAPPPSAPIAPADSLPTTTSTQAPPPAPVSALRTRPLAAWLSEIARDADRDLVISPELRGDLTATEANELPWQQRLEAYSRVSGFEFEVGDGLIEVRRGDGEKRVARRAAGGAGNGVAGFAQDAARADGPVLNAGNGAAASSNGQGAPVAAPEPPPQTRVVRLAYASAKDSAAVLAKAGDALDVTVTADASSNAVVLSGQPAAIGRVLAVIAELDRPRRRILLEAKMIEVTRSARLDLGVEWKITGTSVGSDVKFPPPITDAGSAALVIATSGAAALDARISALEASGKLHVVSRPSVVMTEGSPATIESVRILRIRLPGNGTVVGDEVVTAPSSGRATEDIPVGVRLEVTPAIRGGGRVLLRIKAKSSSLGAPLPPDNIPEELSRMVDAEVLVTSGETAVLGGLLREAGTKSGAGVPGLRSIPGLGLLFGRKSKASEEEELLVLVTPRVLD